MPSCSYNIHPDSIHTDNIYPDNIHADNIHAATIFIQSQKCLPSQEIQKSLCIKAHHRKRQYIHSNRSDSSKLSEVNIVKHIRYMHTIHLLRLLFTIHDINSIMFSLSSSYNLVESNIICFQILMFAFKVEFR